MVVGWLAFLGAPVVDNVVFWAGELGRGVGGANVGTGVDVLDVGTAGDAV